MGDSDTTMRDEELLRKKRALLFQQLKLKREQTAPQAAVIARRSRPSNQFPLSFAQQRLWFFDQLQPGSPAYNLPSAVRFSGSLDVAALAWSLCEVMRRHEILRTTFVMADEQPVQLVGACTAAPLQLLDLRALPAEAHEPAVRRLSNASIQRPFDLARGPLIRATLLRLAEREHIVILTLHHIVSDGWSLGILVRELTQLYAARAAGAGRREGPRAPALPELPIQYADYAAWQREWLQGAVLEQHRDYWHRQLADLPTLALPTDRPRTAVQSFRGADTSFLLPQALHGALAQLCRREDVTLFMGLLAAWTALLARISGQQNIVVGTSIAGRTHAELEPLIGFFVNMLVLRLDARGNPSFVELARRVRAVCLDAYAHQDLPFEQLVEELQPTRDLSRNPLFQVLFALQNMPKGAAELPSATLRPLPIAPGTTRFDLSLAFEESGMGLSGVLEYSTDLFDASTIARLLDQFRRLLEALVTDPEQWIEALPLLSAAARQQLVVEWNAAPATDPPDQLFPQLFAAQAACTPDAVAVVFDGRTTNDEGRTANDERDMGETGRASGTGRACPAPTHHLTYAALDARSNQLAYHLRMLGVGPEVRVGVALARTPALLIGLLGVLKAGGAYLPLDLSYPPARLSFMLEDSQAPVLLTEERLADQLPTFWGLALNLDDDWPQIAQAPTVPLCGPAPDQLAYVIYTSGSTGAPKGVMIPHRGLSNYLRWCSMAYWPASRGGALLHSSISFDLTITSMFAPLVVGQMVVLLDEAADGTGLATALAAARGLSLLKLTPTHLELLAQQLPTAALAGRVQTLVIGGEALRWSQVDVWRDHAPGTLLINEYGPTESVVGCCVYAVPAAGARGATVPIGRPIPNTQLYLLDAALRPVPIGVVGELYLGGSQLARGYLGRPDLTAERFVPNPFMNCKLQIADCRLEDSSICNLQSAIYNRLYRTGDLGRYGPDGVVEFLGRIDGQVKLRGYRIELGEIEAVLAQHPAVRACAVVDGAEAAPADVDASRRLVAYVVPTREQGTGDREEESGVRSQESEVRIRPPTEESASSSFVVRPSSFVSELWSFLAARLPAYMLPSAFVALAALPLTPNGKLDRAALPAPSAEKPGPSYEAPRSPHEALLAAIWAEVLQRPAIARDDDFFALGGHSLLATQVVTRIRATCGVDLPVRAVFEAPTLRALAATLESARRTNPPPPLTAQPRPSRVPLSFAQQRLWFLDQLQGVPLYTIASTLLLSGPLALRALQRSLTYVVARHAALRTRFVLDRDQPVQQIAARLPVRLRLLDLRALAATPDQPLVHGLVTAHAAQPFELAVGPLLRLTLLRLDAEQHLALLAIHHIVADGWSLGVLTEDLVSAYAAYAQGRQPALPVLPVQYADYAIWQRAWLRGAVLEAQLAYWRAQLAGLPALELPTDFARPSEPSFQGASVAARLDARRRDALQAFSQRHSVTLFMTLLAAFQALLARLSGQADLAVGTPIAGRSDAATERLIGCFVNTLVLRLDVRGDPTVPDLLARVRATCLDAYAHQDVPFEQLVEALQPARDLGRTPLFQALFSFQNTPQAAAAPAGLAVRPLALARPLAQFDLTLIAEEQRDGLELALEYRTDLFMSSTAARMLNHLRTLLDGLLAQPQQRVAALPILSAAERQQLLVEWISAPSSAAHGGILALFAAQVARRPDAVALCLHDQQLSYAALDARATRLAHHLHALGAGPEVRVALALPRSLDLPLALLAVWHAGGAFVPLDVTDPPDRLAQLLADAQAALLLTHTALRAGLPANTARVVVLDELARLPDRGPANRLPEPLPEQLAYVIYTSGSTGTPKGVGVPHRGLANLAQFQISITTLRAGDRVLQFARLSFDATVSELLMALLSGATLCLAEAEQLQPGAPLVQLLQAQAINVVTLPPAALAVLPDARLPDLRALLSAGEACPAHVVERWAVGRRFLNGYGPTEASIGAAMAVCAPAPTPPPIGRVLPRVRAYLLDPQLQPVPLGVPGELYLGGLGLARGYLDRPDLTAERFVPNPFARDQGSGVRDQGQEAERRTTNDERRTMPSGCPDERRTTSGDASLSPCHLVTLSPCHGERLYKTGDLARWRPDGALEYLGRSDGQVKLRGFRIELDEIEAALVQHPAVQTAVAVLREEAPGDTRLVAYVVPNEGTGDRRQGTGVSGLPTGDERRPMPRGRLDERPTFEDRRLKIEDSTGDAPGSLSSILYPLSSELRSFLQKRLPDYMVPGAFVRLDALPLTPNGKLDRKALPAPASLPASPDTLSPPRTPTQQLLAQLWAELLHRDTLSLDDHFFLLGGHSLLATQLVARMRSTFQVALPIRALFEHPTLAGQAELIETARRAEQGLQLPPITAASREQPLPLSFAQQRLWFLHQLQPLSPAYNVPSAVRLRGPLVLSALAAGLRLVLSRHESLRTTFAAHAGQPLQLIHPPGRSPLPLLDLGALPPAIRATLAHELAEYEARRPFDLARGPLLRVHLLRLAEREHLALLNMHHIVSDAWSASLLLRELSIGYAAALRDQPARLPALPIQYADYTIWQRTWLRGEVLASQQRYWREQLAGLTPLNLPIDEPRATLASPRGATERLLVPPALHARLRTLGQQAGATLFMTVLAAFQLLLARHSDQHDIVVGTPIANRGQPETADLIGLFLNTLVLRTDLSGNPSVYELLGRVREVCLGAYSHQELPFEQLVEELQPERDLSRQPLFQALFMLEHAPLTPPALAELELEPFGAGANTIKFDLTLSFREDASGLSGELEYNRELFMAARMQRLVRQLEILLEAMASQPQARIGALELLSRAERQQLLHEWNDTAVETRSQESSASRCAHQLFAAQANRTPDAIAVAFADTYLTYAGLDARANRLARYLRRLDVGAEVCVGLYMERTPELLIGILGIFKAGGVYVPLDPAYPAERLAFMLEDSRARVIVTKSDAQGAPARTNDQSSHLVTLSPCQLVHLDADWPLIAAESAHALQIDVSPDHLAYVIYTSGSTGAPKGVMISHRGLTNYLRWCLLAYPLADGAGVPVHSPIVFDLSITSLLAPLLAGRRVVLLAESDGVDALGQALRAGGDFDLVKLTPAHLALLRQQLGPKRAAGRARAFVVGGEQLLADQLAFWRLHAPETLLINEYGPTEAVVGCCVYVVPPQPLPTGAIAIGSPIANTQIYLLDRQLQPAPLGVVAELYIGGAQLARGYLNRPDLTAAAFVPNPFAEVSGIGGQASGVRSQKSGVRSQESEDEARHLVTLSPCHLVNQADTRLYKTGDLARYRADGAIEYVGRRDQQVKLRGYRIELGEIEATLVQHPDVSDAVVALREERPGNQRLVAYIVQGSGVRSQGSEDRASETLIPDPRSLIPELRAFLAARLPDYMVPSAFVSLAALPRTTNGKIDRAALPTPDTQPAPGDRFIAPRTPVEEILAQLWAKLLHLEQIGVNDNFFALGGHSLLGTQVVAQVYAAFGVDLPLRCLFEAPTVAGLAALIEAARQSAPALQAPPLRPALRAGAPPLSFAQQRLWFLDQLQPNSPAYIIPSAVRLLAALDSATLAESLSAIVERHEALRTTFALVDEQPIQVIAPARSVPLRLLDLQRLPATARESLARRLAQQEALQPFDLSRGPLLRATLLRLAAEDHVLLLTMHHIVSDAWSAGIFVRELTALYTARAAGQPVDLPKLPIQYADYAIWQRNWLQGAALEAHLAYWRARLAELPPLDLPTDRPRPPLPTFAGWRIDFALPEALSAALIALSRREEATLFMTLLAAWQTLLARWSGQDDIVIGSPVAGRTRAETEDLIGCFINTLVLSTNLAGNPTFYELLRRVREVCLDAYTHQDLPFEQVVEVVQPARDMSRHPLFQVLFMLQNAPIAPLALPNIALGPLAIMRDTAQFDLTLSIEETPSGLVGSLEYRTDLFEGPTIARMLKHFQALLEKIVADPGLRFAGMALLTRSERQQLLVEWNDTRTGNRGQGTGNRRERCIHELVEAQAERTPDAIAIVFDGVTNDERRTTNDQGSDSSFVLGPSSFVVHLTYAELNARANQLARHLRRLGVGPDVRVGLCLERSLELIVGLLGVLKAGGAYVPLDPAYPAERLAFMAKDSGAQVLITTNDERRTTNEIRGQGSGIKGQENDIPPPDPRPPIPDPWMVVNLRADWSRIAREPVEQSSAQADAENLAYVIYTSGSTGTPKGVMARHRGLVNFTHALAEQIGLRPAQRFLQFASFSFDASALQVFPTLISGATLVLHPDPNRLSNYELLELCRRQAITILDLPAAFWQQWVMDLTAQQLGLPPTIQVGLTGGESIPPERLRTWASLAERPVRFLSSYGPTEATVTTTLFRTSSDQVARLAQPLVPLGRGLANTQLYLLDRHMQPVPIAVVGEIHLGGAGLARGYLEQPGLTAERFLPNPFAEVSGIGYRVLEAEPSETRYPTPDTRLYRTGDLARYLPDGSVEFLGRRDQQLKLRGFRVERGEIAATLEAHPAVREAVVLAREDVPGDPWLVAYVVPVEGTGDRGQGTGVRGQESGDERRTTNDERSAFEDRRLKIEDSSVDAPGPLSSILYPLSSELRAFLAEHLPDHMIPAAIMLLEALPLTPNGKLDQRALPAPNRAAPQLRPAYVLPRDELERRLVGIWENLLGVRPIGVTDNFFALGGHSLLAVGLVAHLQQQLKQNVPLAAIFQGPTIETLACLLRDGAGNLPWSPLVGLLTGGSKLPFFCVHPAGGTVHGYIGLARHLGPDQPCYGLQARGLEDGQLPYTRIEDMAAHYIEALRSVQPHGPYRVGGWSLGGIIAFEMAQQLHRQGHAVSLLAILDTGAPQPGTSGEEPDDAALLIEVIGEQNLAISYDEFRQLALEDQISHVLAWAKQANILPPDSGPSHVYRFLQVFKANVHAVESYEPQVYPGPITLFRTGAPDAGADGPAQTEALDDPALGWGALSTQPIAIYNVPGEHKTMIAEPHVRVLAEQLRHCLDQIPFIPL